MKIHLKRFAIFLALLISFAALMAWMLDFLGVPGFASGIVAGIVFGVFYPSEWSWIEFTSSDR